MLPCSKSSKTRRPTMPAAISRKRAGISAAAGRRLPHGGRPSDVCEDRGERGDFAGANAHWDRILELDPRHLDALIEKGVLLHNLGRLDEAVQCFAVAREVAPENELVLSNLAVALADSGRRHEALAEFHRVVELRPDNIHARHQMRRLTSTIVPFWHIPMLNDARRNDAFERAICAAVEREGPDARILDIGSGSGLLSMMAARAGATNIVSCEEVPVIAEPRSASSRSTAMRSRSASSTRARDNSWSARISTRPPTS